MAPLCSLGTLEISECHNPVLKFSLNLPTWTRQLYSYSRLQISSEPWNLRTILPTQNSSSPKNTTTVLSHSLSFYDLKFTSRQQKEFHLQVPQMKQIYISCQTTFSFLFICKLKTVTKEKFKTGHFMATKYENKPNLKEETEREMLFKPK